MKELSEKEIGYLAATIDCEGTISLSREKEEYCKDWSYHCSVQVGNTDIRLLEYLQKITNIGSIYVNVEETKTCKKKWIWRIYNKNIKIFLETIINDLIIKSEQADLMIDFLKTYEIKYTRGNSIPHNISLERQVLYEMIRELNVKGPKLIKEELI